MQDSLSAVDLTYSLPDGQALFKSLSITLPRIRTGLVGANGIGKTTLLQILAARQTRFEGQVTRPARVSYLAQLVEISAGTTVADLIGIGDETAALGRVESGYGKPEDLDLLDGRWDLTERLEEAFATLGVGSVRVGQPADTLSGGELMRVRLAGLLFQEPDFVLLDEPTNHLDFAARKFVYSLVRKWNSGLVVVSHDRELLSLVDQIVEMSSLGLRAYGGNYDFYRQQREIERQAAIGAFEGARQRLKKARSAAREAAERQEKRASAGGKRGARTGLSKMAIGNLRRSAENSSGALKERHERKVEEARAQVASARLNVATQGQTRVDLEESGIPAGKRVAELREVNFRYPGADMMWARPVCLQVFGPERISLEGTNGSGKSTLLDLIMGRKKPVAGCTILGARRVAMLDQQVSVLDDQSTILQNLKRFAPARPDHELRIIAGRFLFEKDAVFKVASILSGGEKARAGLACILSADQAPELLILDEPSNNLDLPGIEAVTAAIAGYRGALIVVSHDRMFLDEIGVTRTIRLSSAGLVDASGDEALWQASG